LEIEAMKSLFPAILTNLFFVALLLGAAGTASYWPAWLYLAIGVLSSVLTRIVLRCNPELLAERGRPGPDAKPWDRKILGLGFLLTLAILVVAGLDAGRYRWHPRLPWPWSVAGLLLSLAGMILFLLALKENRFFSSVVRIQRERGHTVCDSGPYRVVRHPGSAGMIVGTLGLPLLLLSAWSAIPALIFVAAMIVRTRLEDSALEAELDGYRDYQRTTRYRLVPGLW
jgi:protein-S-isoprenylcysteine O-methyltransferase Ste14